MNKRTLKSYRSLLTKISNLNLKIIDVELRITFNAKGGTRFSLTIFDNKNDNFTFSFYESQKPNAWEKTADATLRRLLITLTKSLNQTK